MDGANWFWVSPIGFQPTGFQTTGFQPTGFQVTGFQPSAIQASAIQASAIQPSAIQPSAIQPSAIQPVGVFMSMANERVAYPMVRMVGPYERRRKEGGGDGIEERKTADFVPRKIEGKTGSRYESLRAEIDELLFQRRKNKKDKKEKGRYNRLIRKKFEELKMEKDKKVKENNGNGGNEKERKEKERKEEERLISVEEEMGRLDLELEDYFKNEGDLMTFE